MQKKIKKEEQKEKPKVSKRVQKERMIFIVRKEDDVSFII